MKSGPIRCALQIPCLATQPSPEIFSLRRHFRLIRLLGCTAHSIYVPYTGLLYIVHIFCDSCGTLWSKGWKAVHGTAGIWTRVCHRCYLCNPSRHDWRLLILWCWKSECPVPQFNLKHIRGCKIADGLQMVSLILMETQLSSDLTTQSAY